MSGFVALHREAFDHPLLRDGDRFRAWFWLVAHAAWQPVPFDVRGKVIMLQRGQVCVSREQLARAWRWSESAVERFLTRLKTEQMIERETGQGKSIVTIRNYDKYQDVPEKTGRPAERSTGQKPDRNRTAKEQLNHSTSYPLGTDVPRDVDPEPALLALPDDAQIAFDEWSRVRAALHPKTRPQVLTAERRKKLIARLKEFGGIDGWRQALASVAASPLLRGEVRDWHAEIDWLLEPKNLRKVMEGNYDDRRAAGSQRGGGINPIEAMRRARTSNGIGRPRNG